MPPIHKIDWYWFTMQPLHHAKLLVLVYMQPLHHAKLLVLVYMQPLNHAKFSHAIYCLVCLVETVYLYCLVCLVETVHLSPVYSVKCEQCLGLKVGVYVTESGCFYLCLYVL